VSYYDAINGDLRLAWPSGPGGNCGPAYDWYCLTLDDIGDVGRYNSIALWAGAGVTKLGVSYHDASTGSLFYIQYAEPGGWTWSWVQGGDPGNSLFNGLYSSLRFDSAGSPRIAYQKRDGLGSDALMLASYVGGGSGNCADPDWTCIEIDTGEGVGQYASLALDAADEARIAYYHAPSGTLRYAVDLGGGMGNCGPLGSWRCDAVDTVSAGGMLDDDSPHISLQAGSNAEARIAYLDALQGKLKYAEYPLPNPGNCGPQSAWRCSEIDAAGSGQGGVSLALDGSGLPLIAYHAAAEGGGLRVAQPTARLGPTPGNCGPRLPYEPDDHTWRCDTADDGSRGNELHDVGQFPAVALHSDGLAAVAYYDATDADLVVAAQTSAAPPPSCGGVFAVTADTALWSDQPNTLHGSDPDIQVVRTGSAVRTALLAFDLHGQVPSGAVVQNAQLELVLTQDPTPLPYRLQVEGVAEPWSEASATWNNAPAGGPQFAPVYHTASPSGAVLRVDVTDLVRLWASGAVTETSVALFPAEGLLQTVRFATRENPDPTIAPRLVVRCAPPALALRLDAGAADARQMAGLARLRQDSAVDPVFLIDRGSVRWGTFELTVPAAVAADPVARAEWFTGVYSDALRLDDPACELQLRDRSPDGQNVFFRQLYGGIPVFPGEVMVQLDGDKVVGVSGGSVPGITLDPTPHISAEQAGALVEAQPGGPLVQGETQLRYFNSSLLGGPNPETYLAWQVPAGDVAYFVDAESGAVLFRHSRTHPAYEIEVWDAHENVHPALCDEWWNVATRWCDEHGCNGQQDPEGYAAWANLYWVWHWWSGALWRDSYDNDGATAWLTVHTLYLDPQGRVGPNGLWTNCGWLIFSDGYAFSRDTIGHEFFHAVNDNTPTNLTYAFDTAALEDSLSDLFGNLTEQNGCPSPDPPWCINWLVGEAKQTQGRGCDEPRPIGTLRDMQDPDSCWLSNGQRYPDELIERCLPSPDAPRGDYCNFNDDFGGAHTNSNIHNKAVYLIVNGGTFNGFNVAGMGWSKAAWLYYHMMHRMPSNSTFTEARLHAIGTAYAMMVDPDWQWIGMNDADVCTIRNAYAAVGIGYPDVNCDGFEDQVDPDHDGDGVRDNKDNCTIVENPGQENIDGDAVGDACDLNDDNDGWLDTEDNCPRTWQANQADWDGNGVGDACDDWDGDGWVDALDTCPTAWDNTNLDTDHDGLGDICDDDDDNDSVPDGEDNCPGVHNPIQYDSDDDGIGDDCDLCPWQWNDPYDNIDNDGDGLGNVCDADNDDDGVLDDGDGSGSPWDHPCTDGNDGHCDDNCRWDKNPEQLDLDGDAIGTACDPDEGDWHTEFGWQFRTDDPLRIPLPDECPECGSDYLRAGYELKVGVESEIGFYGQVVDSEGRVVARVKEAPDGANIQSFEWRPPPYLFNYDRWAQCGAGAGKAPLAPHRVRYWLEIAPAPGYDPGQHYSIVIDVRGGVPSTVYLPLVQRDH